MTVGSIAELPFAEMDATALLGLAWDRSVASGDAAPVDQDFKGFGWGWAENVVLEAADGACWKLERALIIALHSAPVDEQLLEQQGFDLELEVGDDLIHVALDRFLDVWLPHLPEAPDVVLALCNPAGNAVQRPACLAGGTRLWWATGDVDSWGEDDSGIITHGLSARTWHGV